MDNVFEYLKELSIRGSIPEKHKEYLRSLKKEGFEPSVIYDIGSSVLHWTSVAQEIWPKARIILFDAYDPVEFLYYGREYFIGVLSSEDNRTVKFYQNPLHPGGNSYYQEIGSSLSKDLFTEASAVIKPTSRLETIVKKYKLPLPDLIKIDVQGAERDVLLGAGMVLDRCQHLIVELQSTQYNKGAPLVGETFPFIESLGFKCIAPLFCNNGPDGDYDFVPDSPKTSPKTSPDASRESSRENSEEST
jgi:FkbM family methyltransferase